MREIKFRDYDCENKKMIYFTLDQYDREFHDSFGNIMQFTGLHDKNGTEIYEGDIIEFPNKEEWYRNNLIKFHFASICEGLTKQQWLDKQPTERRIIKLIESYEWLLDLEKGKWEVIGNIHENPELLEGL